MSRVTQVMLWEFWKLNRLEFIGRLGYTCGVILFLWYGTAQVRDAPIPIEFVSSISLVFVFCGAAFSSAVVRIENSDVGSVFQLGFTRPVSTAHLVVWRIVFLCVTSVICYLVPIMLVRVLTGVQLPVVSPLLIVITLTICIVTGAWSSSTGFGRILAIVLVVSAFIGAATIFYFNRRQPDVPLLFIIGHPDFVVLHWYQCLSLLLICGVAMTVCIRSVDAQRHGEKRWFGLKFGERVVPVCGQAIVRSSSLLSEIAFRPWQAELWRMWRQSRSTLVAAIAVPLVLAAFISAMQLARKHWPHGPNSWLVTLMLAPFVAQIIAAELTVAVRQVKGVVQLSIHDAVQPVREEFAIGIKLILISALSLVAWLIVAIIASLQMFWAGDVPFWQRLAEDLGPVVSTMDRSVLSHAVAALVACFFLSGAGMLAFGPLTGLIKEKYFYIFSATALVLVTLGVVDLKYDLAFDGLWRFVQVITTLGGIAISCSAIFFVIRYRCLGRVYVVLAITASLIVISALLRIGTIAIEYSPVAIPVWQLILAVVGISFAMPAIAVSPVLALYLHRHR